MKFLSHSTRDVRLTGSELSYGADAVRRRIRELERRLERTSYAGKPGMKDDVMLELSILRPLAEGLEHNAEVMRRADANRIRDALGLERT
jgi:hypothetical protein